MRALTGELLVEAWERGAPQSESNRALTMLAVACPQIPLERLATLGIPERNLQLLRLRQLSFGPTIAGSLPCPSCRTRLEFALPIASLVDRLKELVPDGPLTWTIGPRTYRMRPANSQDLAAAINQPDPSIRGDYFLARCLSVTDAEGAEEGSGYRRPGVGSVGIGTFRAAPSRRRDPVHGEVPRVRRGRHALTWISAGSSRSELRHAAIRFLHEVHELASAYGWSEAAIMTMSSQRRSMYLEIGASMSDLLGRMIARARAPLSPVQPILASLYEPANGPGPEPVTPWPDHEIEREEPSSQEARPLVSPVTSQPGEIQASGPSLVDQPIGRRDPEPRDPEPRMPEPRQPDRTISATNPGSGFPSRARWKRLAMRGRSRRSRKRADGIACLYVLRSSKPPATGRPVTAPVRPATAPTRPVIAPTRPATASTRPEMADQEPEGPSQATVAAGASRSEHSRQAPRPISIPATREWKTEAGVDSGSLRPASRPRGSRRVDLHRGNRPGESEKIPPPIRTWR